MKAQRTKEDSRLVTSELESIAKGTASALADHVDPNTAFILVLTRFDGPEASYISNIAKGQTGAVLRETADEIDRRSNTEPYSEEREPRPPMADRVCKQTGGGRK